MAILIHGTTRKRAEKIMVEGPDPDFREMKTISDVSATIAQIILQPSCGVVGLVEDLLAVCHNDRLQLVWQDGRCQISSAAGGWEDRIELPIRKSVFRAILARVATLCIEQGANSVSPYGGEADLLIGQPPEFVHVAFVNTATEQKFSAEAV